MNRRTKSALLDIAAELIVSPIALYAKGAELKHKFDESEAGKKTSASLKQAGSDISSAAKTFADSQTGQKIKDTAKKTGDSIKGTYQKVKDSEAVQKAKDTAQKITSGEAAQLVKDKAAKVMESDAAQKVKDAAKKVTESPVVQGAKDKFDDVKGFFRKDSELVEEAEADETAEDGVEKIIDDVDISDIIAGSEDEQPEAPIDEEESAAEFEAEADKLESEITETIEKMNE